MLIRTIPETARHVLILLARLTVAFIMLAHVWDTFGVKGFGAATSAFDSFGIPLAIVATAFTLVVELVGSILLALGILVPWASGGITFVMLGAVYFVHAPHGVFVKDNGWELVALIAAVCVAIAAFGPGRFSLDHLIFERKRAALTPSPVDVSSDARGVPVVPAPSSRPMAAWEGTTHWAEVPQWDDAPRHEQPRHEQPRREEAPRWAEPPVRAEQPRYGQGPSVWDDPAPVTPTGTRIPTAYANASRQDRRPAGPVWMDPARPAGGPGALAAAVAGALSGPAPVPAPEPEDELDPQTRTISAVRPDGY